MKSFNNAPKEICYKKLKRQRNSAILAHSVIWALKVFKGKIDKLRRFLREYWQIRRYWTGHIWASSYISLTPFA